MTRRLKLLPLALIAAVLFFGDLAVAYAANEVTDGGFEVVTFPPTNWIVRNQSTTIGTNAQCWNRFTATPWAPHTGVGHSGANFNCTTGANTISGWLISNQMLDLQNGRTIRFWTRKASPDTFPDRLQLRLCVEPIAGDTCGAAGSTGATSTDVGLFTTLLVDVNPTLVTGVYPTVFTEFTAVLAGLPAGSNQGRLGFRYFVTSGGPSGANSDIISIDDVTSPVELIDFAVE